MPVMLTHDTSIDYDVQGSGPPLLLIGGLGFGRWCWAKQTPSSRATCAPSPSTSARASLCPRRDRSVRRGGSPPRLPRCAEYSRPRHLARRLRGQELALERPDLVDRLALVCTSYRGVGPEPISLQALGRTLGWGSLNSEDAVHGSLETATSNAYRESNPEEFGLILRWCLADSSSLPDYSQQVMAGARFEASRHAGDITFPTLVLNGAEERYILVANAVALAEAVPDAELRVIEDAAHLVSIEQSEEVNEEVISFLKPGVAWRFQMPAARQKTSKLVERVEGTNERLVSLLKTRDPQTEEGFQGALQEVVKNYTFGKFERWLRRQSRVPGGWARKLRGGLSR